MFSSNNNMPLRKDDVSLAVVEKLGKLYQWTKYRVTLDRYLYYKKHLPVFIYNNTNMLCIEGSKESSSKTMEFTILGDDIIFGDSCHLDTYMATISISRYDNINIKLEPAR